MIGCTLSAVFCVSRVLGKMGLTRFSSTQQSLYDETVRPLVSSVLEGFNGCVFAYGQTGTGKTHTMEGARGVPEQQGMIPKAFEQIWTHINRTTNTQFLVSTNYLEIYMEEIRYFFINVYIYMSVLYLFV